MKKFDLEKVKAIAIDQPNHRQIYVVDSNKRDLVVNTLLGMNFKTNCVTMSHLYTHLPIVVNTDESNFFTVGSAGIMACACQSKATILNYESMINLLIK